MGVGKVTLVIVVWFSDLLLMDFHCMMVICDLYMASALLVSSMVIGRFLILFF